MRKILLATTLLSIAMSEYILMENYPRLRTAWVRDKQLWNRKTKRIPRKDISSDVEEFLNSDNGRQFSRISDMRFISESKKLSPTAIIRRHDLARFPQTDLLSSDMSKLDSIKPTVLISIGIREENDLQDCPTKKNYHKHQIQQPLYVEEPRWTDIGIDASQHEDGDPYVLTRGKKIFRIKNPKQVDKMIEDYEATLDYPNKSTGLSMKSRMKRSSKMNKESQSKIIDENNQIEERNHYNSLQDTNRDTNNTLMIEIKSRDRKSSKIDKMSEEAKDANHDVFIKRCDRDDLKNLVKRLSCEFKFTNQAQTSANNIITNFVERKQEIQSKDILNDIKIGSNETAKIDQAEKFNNGKSHFAINIKKRSVLLKNLKLPETRKKHETYENDANFKKNVERDEIDAYEKNEVNNLSDLGTSDNYFILFRGKDPFKSGIESVDKKDTDRNNKSIEGAWELQHYAHRKNGEKKTKNEDKSEINKDNIRIMNSQLTSKFESKSSETKIPSNYRMKRNSCLSCTNKAQLQENEWLKNIEKEIQESLSLERRDKHSDVLENLSLGEPYIISRGKKTSHEFRTDNLSSMSQLRNVNDAKMTSLSVAKNLLRMPLMEMSKCNNVDCDVNANRLLDERTSPRDRRGTLDEIFAGYDPYYVIRGKRINQNQKDISYEMDAKQ